MAESTNIVVIQKSMPTFMAFSLIPKSFSAESYTPINLCKSKQWSRDYLRLGRQPLHWHQRCAWPSRIFGSTFVRENNVPAIHGNGVIPSVTTAFNILVCSKASSAVFDVSFRETADGRLSVFVRKAIIRNECIVFCWVSEVDAILSLYGSAGGPLFEARATSHRVFCGWRASLLRDEHCDIPFTPLICRKKTSPTSRPLHVGQMFDFIAFLYR